MQNHEIALNLDRAAHLRRDIAYLESLLDAPESLLIPVWRGQSLITSGPPPRPVILATSEAGSLIHTGGELVWLGLVQDAGCFAIDVSQLHDPLTHPDLGQRGQFLDLRSAGPQMSAADAGLAAYALGILRWHRQNRFCGVCGERTEPRQGGHLRCCTRADCGEELFPSANPAVLVRVTHDNRCLLARQPSWPAGMFSLLAGFVEPGESLEQAVAREVGEEVGLRVKASSYFRSQFWPFPCSLMLGFTAEVTSDRIRLDGEELEDAFWCTVEELRMPSGFFYPGTYALAGEMIQAFMLES